MDDYRAFWADLVEVDGQLDLRKVAAELHDYLYLIKELPGLYDNLTGGAISKPNTRTDVVLEYANARANRLAADAVAEAREEWAQEREQWIRDFNGASILLFGFLDSAGGSLTLPESRLHEVDVQRTVYRIDNPAEGTVTYTLTRPPGDAG
jgi:hypothetical protein